MPKQHNPGVQVSVKLSHETLAAIKQVQARLLEKGIRPGQCSMGHVIGEAVQVMLGKEVPPGAVFCTNCGQQEPVHAAGCMHGVTAKWEKGGAFAKVVQAEHS